MGHMSTCGYPSLQNMMMASHLPRWSLSRLLILTATDEMTEQRVSYGHGPKCLIRWTRAELIQHKRLKKRDETNSKFGVHSIPFSIYGCCTRMGCPYCCIPMKLSPRVASLLSTSFICTRLLDANCSPCTWG